MVRHGLVRRAVVEDNIVKCDVLCALSDTVRDFLKDFPRAETTRHQHKMRVASATSQLQFINTQLHQQSIHIISENGNLC